MFRFSESELYKMLHRKCTYVFFVFFVGGGFFLNLLLKMATPKSQRAGLGDSAIEFWLEIVLTFGWFLVYMIAQIIHGNENKIGAMKNSVSFGINRTQIYIGRFLAQLLLLFVSIVVIAGAVLLGNLVFNGGCGHEKLLDFIQIVALMIPLWIGALSLGHALSMCFNSNTLATVIYMLYFLLGPSILRMCHMGLPDNQIFTFLNKYEAYTFAIVSAKSGELDKNIGLYFAIGGVYLAASFVIGFLIYRRKEIK